MIILILILWISYCLAEGVRDGFTIHKSGLANNYDNKVLGYDVHVYFSVMRLAMIIVCSLVISNNVLEYLFYAVDLALMQPFLSNGMYFYTRNKLDNITYPNGFVTDIKVDNSSAKIDIDKFRTRYIMFALGLASILVIQLYHLSIQ